MAVCPPDRGVRAVDHFLKLEFLYYLLVEVLVTSDYENSS